MSDETNDLGDDTCTTISLTSYMYNKMVQMIKII